MGGGPNFWNFSLRIFVCDRAKEDPSQQGQTLYSSSAGVTLMSHVWNLCLTETAEHACYY